MGNGIDDTDSGLLQRTSSIEWDVGSTVSYEDEAERRKKETIYQAWTSFASSLLDKNLLSLSNERCVYHHRYEMWQTVCYSSILWIPFGFPAFIFF